MIILKNKAEQRALHWSDIKSRVTTHEGEVLSGKKGVDYQRKYGKRYLGRDLSAPNKVSVDRVYQYEKTGK